MTKKSTDHKYINYYYEEKIEKLLSKELTDKENEKLENFLEKVKLSTSDKNYRYILKDIYLLKEKYLFSTKDLAAIYDINVRTAQVWLKDLGLNKKSKTKRKETKQNTSEVVLKSESKDFFDSYDFFQKNSFQNQDIPSSLVDFLNYLETIKGKSPNTLKAYKGDLSLFFKFLKAYKFGLPKGVDLLDLKINELDDNFIQKIELRDLYAFLNYVEQIRSNGSYAKSRKVAALKSYFKFLQNKLKIIKENPAVELESPKIEKRNPKYLTLEESLNLLKKMDSSKKNYPRDYCILVLFLNCGMRLSELCNIKLSKLKEDRLSIIGKGDKERVVYLNNSCIKAIDNYLKVRDLTKVPIEFRDYLFISRVNKPIDKRTVELLVKKYIKEAGIGEGYTPHKLRHTAATLMYKYGEVDIRSIQNILGHESISTTQIYTHVDDDSLREAVKQNPLSNL